MPFSSRIRITPMARASTIVSGCTGSWLITSASSGSPSSQNVRGNETVVGRIVDGAVQDAVQPEQAVSLSSSYLFLLPFGTSMTTGNAFSTSASST